MMFIAQTNVHLVSSMVAIIFCVTFSQFCWGPITKTKFTLFLVNTFECFYHGFLYVFCVTMKTCATQSVDKLRDPHSVVGLHIKFCTFAPALGGQILSISCTFWENLVKSHVGFPLEGFRPHLGEILDPPLIFAQNPYKTMTKKLMNSIHECVQH